MLNWNVIDFISPMLFNIFIIFIIIVIFIIFIFTDFLVPLFFVLLFFFYVSWFAVMSFLHFVMVIITIIASIIIFINFLIIFCFALLCFYLPFPFTSGWKLLFSNETFNVSKMLCLLVICFFDLFFFSGAEIIGWNFTISFFFSSSQKLCFFHLLIF